MPKLEKFIPVLLTVQPDAQRPVFFEDTNEPLPDGVSSVDWHAMSDERRAQFMREKRKNEAFKTEMCKGFIRTGFCKYGVDFRFPHLQEELRIRPMRPKFKTELCLNFSVRGDCGYGSRCQFIHGSPDSTRSRSTSSGYSSRFGPSEFHRSLQPNHRQLLDYRYLPRQQLQLQHLRNQLFAEAGGYNSNGGSDGSSSGGANSGMLPPEPLPASCFAVSAYVPRDRHPFFNAHHGQALRRHLETQQAHTRGSRNVDEGRRVTRLLSKLNERSTRDALLNFILALKTSGNFPPESSEQINILVDLESYDKNRIEEVDLERRFLAFGHLEELYERGASAISCEMVQVFAHSHAYCLSSSSDIALRKTSSNALRRLICFVSQNFQAKEADYISHGHLVPLVLDGLNPHSEICRTEFVYCLADMIARFPTDTHLERLQTLNKFWTCGAEDGVDAEPTEKIEDAEKELNFFENAVHIQIHRRQRAFYRFTEQLISGEVNVPYNLLLRYVLPLCKPYLMETTPKLSALSDQSLNLFAVILERCSWRKYHQTLELYLRQIDEAEKTKGIVRVLFAILGSFRFDVADIEVPISKSQPVIENLSVENADLTKETASREPNLDLEEEINGEVSSEGEEANEEDQMPNGSVAMQRILDYVVILVLPRLRQALHASVNVPYDLLLRYVLPLCKPYLMETTPKLSALSDQSLNLFAVILERCSWRKYHQMPELYLRQIDEAEKTKGIVRVLFAILGSFRFDVADIEVPISKSQPVIENLSVENADLTKETASREPNLDLEEEINGEVSSEGEEANEEDQMPNGSVAMQRILDYVVILVLPRLRQALHASVNVPYDLLLRYVLPLCKPYLMETTPKLSALSDQSLNLFAVILERCSWRKYHQMPELYLRQIDEAEKTKGIVRVLFAILGSFRFDVADIEVPISKSQPVIENLSVENADLTKETASREPNLDLEEEINGEVSSEGEEANEEDQMPNGSVAMQRILDYVVILVLPRLRQALHASEQNHHKKSHANDYAVDEELLTRAPIVLAMAKILQKLPGCVLKEYLNGLVASLNRLVLSRSTSVRLGARKIMGQFMQVLGAKHLPFVIKELRQTLLKGFQLYAMIFTVHTIIAALEQDMKSGDLDDCVQDIFEKSMDVALSMVKEERKESGHRPDNLFFMILFFVLTFIYFLLVKFFIGYKMREKGYREICGLEISDEIRGRRFSGWVGGAQRTFPNTAIQMAFPHGGQTCFK